MPTILSHAIAGAAIGYLLAPRGRSVAIITLAAAAAMAPDADVLGFRLGIDYGDLLGHRGLTHSLLFAAVLAGGVAATARLFRLAGGDLWRIAAAVFAAAVSHGLLDALTNGGLGVAFFAPFNNTRYFFPATPIEVAPLRVEALFSWRGADVIASEALWVWAPTVAIVGVAALVRRPTRRGAGS